jgi:ribosomal protein S10
MLYLYLTSYNNNLLEKFCENIFSQKINHFEKNLKGPITLPTKKNLYTVIRSPHIYSLSREQFELSTFRKLIILKRHSYSSNCFLEVTKQKTKLEFFADFYYSLVPGYVKEEVIDWEFLIKKFIKQVPVGISLKVSYLDK